MSPSFREIVLDSDVLSLLTAADLPTQDLTAGALAVRFYGALDERGLLGVIAIENHGGTGLLRSLAVRPEFCGGGYGRALIWHAEEFARKAGIEDLYLLTTTAAGLFERSGFSHIHRANVPAAVRATQQFAHLCPSTCAVMHKSLTVNPTLQS